jgi:uncharacterized SAM-binding protein YcdF (DUF218 family)
VEEKALMFFVLSKTIAFLLLPSNLLIALVGCGAALLATRWWRTGVRLASISLAILVAAGFLPVGNLLIHALESRFPPWDTARGAPDGIVVLGGAIAPTLSQEHGEAVIYDAPGRIVALAKLARQFPAARIIYSGGNADLVPGGPAEADFVPSLFDSLGVPRERVVLENRSRNTAENATFSKDIAKPKPGERWLLITSAMHMPRAIGCFRRAGFAVEAYPVDWRTGARAPISPRRFRSASACGAPTSPFTSGSGYWPIGRPGGPKNCCQGRRPAVEQVPRPSRQIVSLWR